MHTTLNKIYESHWYVDNYTPSAPLDRFYQYDFKSADLAELIKI